jgi:hypothetical protein
MRFCFLIIPALIFWGCPDSASTTDTDSPLRELQFTFLQDDQVLYFAIDLAPSVRGYDVDEAVVYWYGTDATRMVTPDRLELYDKGESGDIIEDDDLWSLKIKNNTLTQNPIENDTGRVYMDFEATYKNNASFMVQDSFYLGNLIPRIVFIPPLDTIFLPDSGGVKFDTVKATVHDANGLDDIRRVGFFSYHVDDSTFLNEGNIINLYDDGSEVILYEPNFTSGDATANDGIYSFRVPVFGPGNLDSELETKTGTFLWIFDAVDMANTHSNPDTQTVVVVDTFTVIGP